MRNVYKTVAEHITERDHLEDQGTDGRLILWILEM